MMSLSNLSIFLRSAKTGEIVTFVMPYAEICPVADSNLMAVVVEAESDVFFNPATQTYQIVRGLRLVVQVEEVEKDE